MTVFNDERAAAAAACARCGENPPSVIDGAFALCGDCYHVEVLRQRRRAAMKPSGNAALDAVRKLEVVIWRQIAPCDCLDD